MYFTLEILLNNVSIIGIICSVYVGVNIYNVYKEYTFIKDAFVDDQHVLFFKPLMSSIEYNDVIDAVKNLCNAVQYTRVIQHDIIQPVIPVISEIKPVSNMTQDINIDMIDEVAIESINFNTIKKRIILGKKT